MASETAGTAGTAEPTAGKNTSAAAGNTVGAETAQPITIKTLIAPAKPGMVLSAILTSLGALCSLVPYIALVQIAVIWLAGGSTGELLPWIIVAIVATVLYVLLYGMGLQVSHLVEAKLRYTLRKQIVDKLGKIPLGRVENTSAGALRKTVVDETSSIHTLVAHVAGDAANAVVSLLGGLAVLFWADWKLALAMLAVWTVFGVVVGFTSFSDYGKRVEEYRDAQTRLSSSVVEMFEGIKEIKNFQAADAARTEFDSARTDLADVSYEWMRATSKSIALIFSFLKPGVVIATLTPLAVLFLVNGWTDIPHILPFFMIGIGLPSGLATLVTLMQHIYESEQAAAATAALLSQPDLVNGSESSDQPAAISFENVSFGYQPNNPVIHNASFTAEANQVTALVGPSGGGKTTLARLAARFYDVDSGVVRVCGKDVRELDQEWLLQQISIVFQDIALSHDTVANNISVGVKNASQDDIVAAAKAAQIHDRITRLPNGYDTVIGDKDGFLSGGEMQRITIARAYLRNTPILILDEATASTDPQSEHDIHRALTELSRGRTVFIIAHRLATIASANKIVVVADGTVAEAGTHTELLALDGVYAGMWRKQNGEVK